MRIRRSIAIIVLIVAFVAILPTAASAGAADLISGGVTNTGVFVLDLGSDLLDVFTQLVVRLIASMGGFLQSVLEFQPTYGGATVYQLWSWLRNLCNMLFIVVLVAIAFGTIFNTLKPTGFHARQSLALFIAAAILINLSLAVGQTIVWAGNQATELVLGFMPDNVGAQAASSLNLVAVTIGAQGAPIGIVPSGEIPTEELTEVQRNQLDSWITGAQTGAGAPTLALQTLEGCLQRNEPVGTCFETANRISLNQYILDAAQGQKTADQNSVASQILSGRAFQGAFSNAFSYYLTGTFTEAGAPSETLSGALSKFSMLLVRAFLLLVLTLSFATIILFMMVRIPAIWFLLALSAPAFFALAVPSARKQFSVWFKNIVGISVFGPLYLLVIYLGLFVLSTQGSLIASGNNVNDLPFISGIFGTAFFYFIAAAIFIGGAAAVTKFAFNLSPTAGAIFGVVGGRLGVSPASQFGIQSIARGLGAVTGASRVTRGAQEGARERYERVVSRPLAARGQRFEEGVRTLVAGGKARQDYLQGRIKNRTERLDKQLQKQTERAAQRLEQAQLAIVQAEARVNEASGQGIRVLERANRVLDQATAQRAKAEQGMGQLKKSQEEKLRGILQEAQAGRLGKDNETAIAAGNQLMKLQKITVEELANLQQRYAQISPAMLQIFTKQRNEQLQKDAKTRKYVDADEMKSFLRLVTDKKEAGKFFESAKGSKTNKVPAIIAGVELRLIPGPDGKTPVTDVQQELNRQANNFNANDLLKATEYLGQQGINIAEERGEEKLQQIQSRYARFLHDVDRYADIRATANTQQLKQLQRDKYAFEQLTSDLRSKLKQAVSPQERSELSNQINRLTKQIKERETTAGEQPKTEEPKEKKQEKPEEKKL